MNFDGLVVKEHAKIFEAAMTGLQKTILTKELTWTRELADLCEDIRDHIENEGWDGVPPW